ncbi:uncharacterized protein LOC123830321 isoform X2 [Phyllostomus hastatus]|uniref:uncharacterized protein LOC123830321 isoform X2 n=1 Tax=Phyllostomus hastatus TaxID=9423 RepID=UPI001E684E48|nr:uncharacterized protein LOC123830321 isoform X2 [Phyllostomus hastatus]
MRMSHVTSLDSLPKRSLKAPPCHKETRKCNPICLEGRELEVFGDGPSDSHTGLLWFCKQTNCFLPKDLYIVSLDICVYISTGVKRQKGRKLKYKKVPGLLTDLPPPSPQYVAAETAPTMTGKAGTGLDEPVVRETCCAQSPERPLMFEMGSNSLRKTPGHHSPKATIENICSQCHLRTFGF